MVLKKIPYLRPLNLEMETRRFEKLAESLIIAYTDVVLSYATTIDEGHMEKCYVHHMMTKIGALIMESKSGKRELSQYYGTYLSDISDWMEDTIKQAKGDLNEQSIENLVDFADQLMDEISNAIAALAEIEEDFIDAEDEDDNYAARLLNSGIQLDKF